MGWTDPHPRRPRSTSLCAWREDAVDTKREQMIVDNLPLVSFVVSKMSDESGSQPFDREDAIAYGVEGLIQAVDNYDPARGTSFASFAIRRIRGSVLDAVRRMDLLPRSLRKSAREIERANLELAGMLGRWPTPRELALRLGLQVENLRQLMGHSRARTISLEKLMDERASESSTPWEATDPDEFADPAAETDRKAGLQLLGQALSSLSVRDQEIVQLRYAKAMPFHEIGRLMNLSESRVCQLHKRILTSLKSRLKQDMEIAA
jgi:RNA polymerase sigma factor for flagellar operon FliA